MKKIHIAILTTSLLTATSGFCAILRNGAVLNGAMFNGTRLNGTHLNASVFNGTRLNGISRNRLRPNGTRLNDTRLNGTTWNSLNNSVQPETKSYDLRKMAAKPLGRTKTDK